MDPVYPEIPEQESYLSVFEGETLKVRDMGYCATYRCFVRAIVITMTRKETNRHMYFLMANEHRLFDSYRVQSRILSEHHIETVGELSDYRAGLESKLKELIKMRQELRNGLKRAERQENSELIHEIRFNIELASRQIRDARDEIKACDQIALRSERVRDKLEIIEEGRFKGKEKDRDEHIR